ncbi:MAG: T9SS type A sorting domain-containing protein [Bacteroidetes bacterium]|nr:T9SS type A sorting domain-containing protein [Bacteroidota bacterium]
MRIIIASIIAFFFFNELAAQCTTFAGTSPNLDLEYCENLTVVWDNPNDMVNDGNDVFFYTVHLGTQWNQNVAAAITFPGIDFGSSLFADSVYHISLIMGNPNNGGSWIVDENDPCLSVIDMGTIVFHEMPKNDFTIEGITCGQPGWQVTYGSQAPGYSYLWTGPNGFTSTLAEPILPEVGTYLVEITSQEGCNESYSFGVVDDPFIPEAGAYLANPTLCEDTFRIEGYPVVNHIPLTYDWYTVGGEIVQDNGGSIYGTGDAEYCVVITNPKNGCADTACVDVVVMGTPPIADAGPQQTLSCLDGTAQLGGPNTSMGTQFTYEWTCAGCPPSTSIAPVPFPTVDQVGTYLLAVTDTTTGCQAFYDTAVNPGPIFLNASATPVVCEGDSVTIIVTTFTSNPPFTIFVAENGNLLYQFDNALNTLLIKAPPISGPTEYQVWVSDAINCQAFDTVDLSVTLDTLDINFTVENIGCNGMKVFADLTSNAPINTYLMNWSTGDVVSPIFVTSTGWYSVTVQDGYGCSFVDSLYVTVDFSGQCSFIEGNVNWDTTPNCSFDNGEPALAGWFVQADNGNQVFYGTTDANGYYHIQVDPGNYTVTLTPPNGNWDICLNDVNVSLPNANDTAIVDFLAYEIPSCPSLTVDIATPQLRRCFGANYYFVNYCNEGTATATDAYVVLNFDAFLTLDLASIPYTYLGNNTYRFEVGDLEVGECGGFWTSMTVSCNAVLGQTHCTEAHIYPDSACVAPNPLWSGASLALQAVCDDSLHFTITNVGTAPMTLPLEYVVIEDIVMYMQAPPPSITLDVAQSYEFNVPANGATWRLEVTQEPFHPAPSYPVLAVEGCGTNQNGGISTGMVNLFPLGDPEPYVDIDCTENIGGCDPNGKYAYPTGVDMEHFIEPNKDIEYIIRFQNTGTDTAFNVVIRDTISQFLDLTSIRPGASSHPYNFEVYGTGILKFSFPNIQLPDSTINEPASNGFVTYRISQREDVPLSSVIENSAAIYFDFNEPVITNTVFHTVGMDFLEVVSDASETNSLPPLKVFPNPASESVTFTLPIYLGENSSFQLQDQLGKLVLNQPVSGNQFRFERMGMASGIYFYSIKNDGMSIYSGKVILR